MPLPFIGHDGYRRKHDDLTVHLQRIGEEMRRLMTGSVSGSPACGHRRWKGDRKEGRSGLLC